MRRYSYPAKALKILAFLEVGDKRTAPVARLQLPGVKVETGDVPRFLGLEPWSPGRSRGCQTVVVLEILKPSSWELLDGYEVGTWTCFEACTMAEYRPPFSATFFSQGNGSCGSVAPTFQKIFPRHCRTLRLLVTLLRTVRSVTFQDLVGGSAENSEQRAIGKITIKRNMVKICKKSSNEMGTFQTFSIANGEITKG